MKTIINKIKENYKIFIGAILVGTLIGFFIGKPTSNQQTNTSSHQHINTSSHQIWTCSMHPQIRMDKPGKCPICGMDLIPLQEDVNSETTLSPDEIQMTAASMKIADIQTMPVKKAYPDKEVYLLGKVKPDERNISELTARFGGRIEKLHVNFTGQNVKKGERLATIYSPALITAQKELLEAVEYKESTPSFYMAARNKLKLWDLTEGQIDGIEKKGEPKIYFDVLSPISGTVTMRYVALGDYVKEGNALFRVVDLTKVWVMFEAYESDLPWIKLGDKVEFTIQSLPGKNFNGHVSFIDPLIDPKTRIAQVRVEIQNQGLLLKPEMFANGVVTSSIAGNQKDLMIPKTSVLWTGKRAVVYVKVPGREQPTFKYREIILGPSAGEFYVVKAGLSEGEEIAVNGVFKIDAAAQLAGKPSMMNPEGGSGSMGSMPGMSMNGGIKGQSPHNEMDMSTEKPQKGTTGEKIYVEAKRLKINPRFKEQLTTVYNTYLPLKNAFIKSNPHEVAQIAEKVSNALNEVDMKLLEGQTHMVWMDQLGKLKVSLEKMKQNHDVKTQREAFAAFNLTFYQSVKDFGLEGVTTYYQYCPMAVDQKGAYWFSEIKQIKNPYFGEAMLQCGETSETLKY